MPLITVRYYIVFIYSGIRNFYTILQKRKERNVLAEQQEGFYRCWLSCCPNTFYYIVQTTTTETRTMANALDLPIVQIQYNSYEYYM